MLYEQMAIQRHGRNSNYEVVMAGWNNPSDPDDPAPQKYPLLKFHTAHMIFVSVTIIPTSNIFHYMNI